MQIGKRIKEIRKAKKITLAQLSESSGVQVATLSRIENGKMTGTLESHMNIAKALGVELTQLYQGIEPQSSPPPVSVNKETLLESFTYNDKSSYEILATSIMSKKMMPLVMRVEAGGKTNPEQNQPGSEKFVFVLEGQIKARIAGKEFVLDTNNTLYFNASQRHWFVNEGTVTAKAIVVVTPVSL